MKLISGQYSLVIVNPAITPMAAAAFRDWEKFGKLTQEMIIPPLFRAELGANIAIQAPEGKVEVIYKSTDFGKDFQTARNVVKALLNAFQAFETTAVGVNFKAVYIQPDFNFAKWRNKVFRFQFTNSDAFDNKQIVTSQFKLGLRESNFIRNIEIAEFRKNDDTGLLVNNNNHFDLNTEKKLLGIIDNAEAILKETKAFVENLLD